MKKLSDQAYKMAFQRWWYSFFQSKEKDLQVRAFLRPEIKAYDGGDSWLRGAREASLISLDQAAQKMGVSRAGFHALEAREETGKVTLESLAKAAEAIDCELVYAIRPKKREMFSILIWQKLQKAAEGHHWVQTRPERMQANALAKIASDYFYNSKFRQQQGWTERRQPSSQFKISKKNASESKGTEDSSL